MKSRYKGEEVYSISYHLNFGISQLKRLMYNKTRFYTKFDIPKKAGGIRTIMAPHGLLKSVQKKILLGILYKDMRLHPHQNAYGFVRRKSIFNNASLHLNKKLILKVDIKNYFPSITIDAVKKTLINRGYSEDAADLLSELVTYENVLPQGAPTSPYIANLVCIKLDTRLSRFAKSCDLAYSRYADDMTFSGNTITGSIIHSIVGIINDEGFAINTDKLRVKSRATKQFITGLIVNSGKPTFGKAKYLTLKAILHNIKRTGPELQNRENIKNYKAHLIGKISSLKKLDVKKWERLKHEIDSIDWGIYEEGIYEKKVGIIKDRIFSLFSKINELARVEIFKADKAREDDMLKTCKSKEEFNSRVSNLFNWIDNMKTEYFVVRLHLDNLRKKGEKSIKIVARYLDQTDIDSKSKMFLLAIWNSINALAAGIVRHDIPENVINEIFYRYRINKINPNYEIFWFKLLNDFAISLNILFDVVKAN